MSGNWFRKVRKKIRIRHSNHKSVHPSVKKKIFKAEIKALRLFHTEKIFAACNGRIQAGLFNGMTLSKTSAWGKDLVAMLLGAYEQEVQRYLANQDMRKYQSIIDVGCANGFYAVGLALICPNARIFAFDVSQEARELTAQVARMNGVSNRLIVGGRCKPNDIQNICHETHGDVLAVVDIEGAELDLIQPEKISSIPDLDLLIECHDRGNDLIKKELTKRLSATHDIEVIQRNGRKPADFPMLADLPDLEFALTLCEMRVRSSCWIWANARS